MNWINLTSEEQLNQVILDSGTRNAVIFKHSTRCLISSMVLRRFEKSMKSEMDAIDFYFLDLLKYRALSDKIASDFNVRHQSPQLLYIKNGETIAHHSHFDIISSFNLANHLK